MYHRGSSADYLVIRANMKHFLAQAKSRVISYGAGWKYFRKADLPWRNPVNPKQHEITSGRSSDGL